MQVEREPIPQVGNRKNQTPNPEPRVNGVNEMGAIMKRHLLAGAALSVLMTGSAWAEIVIGVAGPMTGQYATFGEQMRAGAEQAVADINAAGGINGEQLRLVIGDDACDPKQAVAVANQFAGDGVVFSAGHFCPVSSHPASQVYADDGILQFSSG